MHLTNREKFIALTDNDGIQNSDAIILLEGDGFNRYKKAVDLYKLGFSSKIIFSGGSTDYNYGSYPYSDILPKILNLGIPEKDIIHEKKSKNTKEQAIEVIKIANENNWKKLILVATHDHQYRAYLTFLKEVFNNGKDIILFNSPVRNLKWFEDNVWGKRIDNINNEFIKIEKYMKVGDLATYEEAIIYQELKENKFTNS
mgnify:FL=1